MEPVDDGATVSARTRALVYAFLLTLAVTGVAHLELFPFSGFKLFSERKPSVRESWALRAVDERGEEIPIRIGDLPLAYRNTSRLLLTFDGLSAPARDEICDAWSTPLREDGVEVTGVRVYRVVDEVKPDDRPARRSVAYECGGRA
ncbi:MAG: hypothetical protein ABL966_05150 [Acidimicrobiales bacterium]